MGYVLCAYDTTLLVSDVSVKDTCIPSPPRGTTFSLLHHRLISIEVRMRAVIGTVCVILTTTLNTEAQLGDLFSSKADSSRSTLSSILKSSGSLVLKEYHSPVKVTTTEVKTEMSCQVIVARNLLYEADQSWHTVAGLSFTGKAEYAEKNLYLDADEVDALAASLRMLQSEGEELLATALVSGVASPTRDIQFSTREGLSLACAVGQSFYCGVKLGSSDDWRVLTESGLSELVSAVTTAKGICDQFRD
jgi:hypothetical protein